LIINQESGPIVPDKTIVYFPLIQDNNLIPFDLNNVNLFLKSLNENHKRDWFNANFYKCLPLAIGNMQGFVFSLPYTFTVLWNGGNDIEDLSIKFHKDFKPYKNMNFIYPSSEFGSGILTIHFPLTLKTPPGINLMTIAPPNFPTLGLSPMTGVIESDNIRFSFTLNIKIDLINTKITVLANSPLIGIIPIPRYFCDSFKLQNAYDIFNKNIVEEEILVVKEHADSRIKQNQNNLKPDKIYYNGKDIKGNVFKDHQLPKKKQS
jgi:Family of unknown function (DUF6065)